MRMRASLAVVTAVLALAPAGIVFATGRDGEGSSGSTSAARDARRATSAPASATAAFGLDMMRRLGGGNVVFSPDSVAVALAMAGTGAAGRTAQQIASALHLSTPADFPAVGALQRRIAREQASAAHGSPAAPTLDLADGLFLQRGFAAAPAFLRALRDDFGAPPQEADFERDPAGAVQQINAWANEHTQGLIPHILGGLADSTRLVLANAVYLKATWAEQFKERASAPDTFHSRSGPRSVTFMHQTADLLYGSGHGYAILDLPYAGSTLSLAIVLPVHQSVGALLGGLTPARLKTILGGTAVQPVRVSLPRFHLASHESLVPTLRSLGIHDAFEEGRANFSRISGSVPLEIGQVAHAADFKLDEQGTVAAATTVVTIEATSAPSLPANPIPFDANRPFLFFLRDDSSGAVLFAGRLSDPNVAPG